MCRVRFAPGEFRWDGKQTRVLPGHDSTAWGYMVKVLTPQKRRQDRRTPKTQPFRLSSATGFWLGSGGRRVFSAGAFRRRCFVDVAEDLDAHGRLVRPLSPLHQ